MNSSCKNCGQKINLIISLVVMIVTAIGMYYSVYYVSNDIFYLIVGAFVGVIVLTWLVSICVSWLMSKNFNLLQLFIYAVYLISFYAVLGYTNILIPQKNPAIATTINVIILCAVFACYVKTILPQHAYKKVFISALGVSAILFVAYLGLQNYLDKKLMANTPMPPKYKNEMQYQVDSFNKKLEKLYREVAKEK